MTHTLFVYGTLRKGSRHPNARRLAREARWLGRASAKGALWRVRHYPGFVGRATACGRVTGDLYRLRSPASFAWLDPYEMCGPDDPLPHPYRRGRVAVRWRGRAVRVGTYFWVAPVAGLRRLARGDWLAQ